MNQLSPARAVLLEQLQRLGRQVEAALSKVTEAQAGYKPVPALMSILSTLEHLSENNLMVAAAMEGRPFSYGEFVSAAADLPAAIAEWRETRRAALDACRLRADDDQVTPSFGTYDVLTFISLAFSEHDAYHLGQICYLRQAADPSWDMYSIYS